MNHQEPAADIINTKGSRAAFYGLLVFTFVVYVTPQAYYGFLEAFRPAKVSIGFTLLAHAIHCFRTNQPILRLDTETKLCLAIVCLAILSVPFSLWPGGSLSVLTDLYLKVVIVFLFVPAILTSPRRVRIMLWLVVLCCTWIAFEAIQDFRTGMFIRDSNRISGARGSLTANPNDLALTVVLSVPFILSFLTIYKKFSIRLICIFCLIISNLGIICTFSRGGFLALVVLYAIFIGKMYKKHVPKALLASIALFVLFIALSPKGYSERLASIFDFSKDKTGSADARKHSMELGIKYIRAHPIVGAGLGMNILIVAREGNYWNTIHNVYLQLAADMGIPAMILFIVLLLRLIKGMNSMQKHPDEYSDNEVVPLAYGIEMSLITFAVSAIFHPVAYHFYFYYLAGYAIALSRIKHA